MAEKRAAKVQNTEYAPITNETVSAADATGKTGRNAGDLADKTYYVDALDPDSKPSTTAPERARVLVAEGDVITEDVAAQLKAK